jgi:phosphodiesterase/alkaline phosphatase D-like protein
MIQTRRELLAQAAAATGVILLPGYATTRPTPRFSEQAFTLGVASGYPTSSSLVL